VPELEVDLNLTIRTTCQAELINRLYWPYLIQ